MINLLLLKLILEQRLVVTKQPPDYVTSKEAAELLDVSLRTIQLWVENGTLRAWKTPGGHRRVYFDSIKKELDKRTTGYRPLKITNLVKKPLSVIVVDDDPFQKDLITTLIKNTKLNIDLHSASDGYEGLVIIGKITPDLAIIDLSMPNIDGFSMIKALISNNITSNMDIVVLTGLNDTQIAEHGGLPDSIPVFQKPIRREKLEEILFSMIKSHNVFADTA